MKKQVKKSTKTKTNKNNLIIGGLGALVIILGVTSVCLGMRMKTSEEERYLALYPTLLSIEVLDACDRDAQSNGTYAQCELQEYGVADDGSPYVIYKRQVYSTDPVEPIGSAYMEKKYFWEDEDGGFSTVMDTEFEYEITE